MLSRVYLFKTNLVLRVIFFSSTPRKTMSFYASLPTPDCSFSLIEREVDSSDERQLQLFSPNGPKAHEVIPTDKYYIIRPHVSLTGLSNGYMWTKNNLGLWRSFMNTNKKIYTTDNTGKHITPFCISRIF